MKNSVVYSIWAVLYCICVGLGFAGDPEGAGKVLFILTGIISFMPPAYLAWKAKKEKNTLTFQILLGISACVLILSTVLLMLNFVSVYFSAKTGLVFHVMLVMFSAPTACCQSFALGLFLWACVFVVSLKALREQSRPGQT